MKYIYNLNKECPETFNSKENIIIQNNESTILKIFNSDGNKYKNHLIDRKTQVPMGTKGLLVMHKTEYYVGCIDSKAKGSNKNNYWIKLNNDRREYVDENKISIIGKVYDYVGFENKLLLCKDFKFLKITKNTKKAKRNPKRRDDAMNHCYSGSFESGKRR